MEGKHLQAVAPSIRMGEMLVTGDGLKLQTLLGSCVGLALYDRRRKVGGLAHIVLPESRGRTTKHGKFVDTAIPQLIEKMNALAGEQVKPIAKLAGGASMFSTNVTTQIGQQNIEACETLLRQLGIPIVARHCGGEKGRRMLLDTTDGRVRIEIVGHDAVEL